MQLVPQTNELLLVHVKGEVKCMVLVSVLAGNLGGKLQASNFRQSIS